MTRELRRPVAPLLLMVASGFAGLGYQIVWTQRCALWLGHESAAVLAVVAAFFGGLALGALALGGRIERSPRPVGWYAGCELVIALWSLLLVAAMAPVSGWVLRLTGAEPAPGWQWLVAFLGTFLVLLPATAAMGATLPAMERLTAPAAGRSIAPLYAANTAGAVLGVLATAFWLVPAFGLARTSAACAALNLLCGAIALVAFPARTAVPARPGATRRGGLAPLALTGFLGIGYEVLVARVLSQVTEETVYTFALLLAVYLVGTAAGAAAYHRWLAKREPQSTGDRLAGLLAGACLAGTASLWGAERVKAVALDLLGGGVGAALAAEGALALFAFGPATLVMGALFSHLCRRAGEASGFGRALAVNTLGAALAPAVFGVVVLPALGAKLSLLLVGAGYLALVARRSWARPATWATAVATLALALFTPRLAFVDVPERGRVVSYQEGVMASVSVVEDADGVARLRIDNRQQEGSSGTLRVDARQAWLPLLLHPAPRQALFLGLGTGVTAASASQDPALHVDAVELLPEVITASAHFRRDLGDPARLRVIAADARRYVRTALRRYDVIVSDNFHPARSGSGSLYTVEHFQAVRGRLEPDGLFCQWLPLHQLDLETLRSIVRSFLTAYPHGWAMIASNSLETPVLGLVGRADDGRIDVAGVRHRLGHASRPAGLGLEDDLAVLGGFIAGPVALGRFAGEAVTNTDDHPVVAYRAPRITYAPDSHPRDRLLALLRQVAVAPDELIAPPADPAWPRRLAAYWVARDRFIAAGRDVRPAVGAQEMLAQVREPLLSVLRISPDFRPAYDPLVAMATALAVSDPSAARNLLNELVRLQPARDEAPRALALIDPAR
jgi:spermidine synthase